MRVIVTRPARQAQSWAESLRTSLPLDVDVTVLPLIDIGAPGRIEPVDSAWQRLTDYRLVVFVSPSAAQWFFDLRPARLPAAWPAATLAAAPGPGTAAALLARGVPTNQLLAPAADAAQFDSETLWAQLGGLHQDWHAAQVLMVCGGDDDRARGRPWLAQQLQARGAQVHTLVTYQRRAPQLDAAQLTRVEHALREPARHVWLFSSSEAIAHLIDLQRARGWPAPASTAVAIATHPRIAEAAQAAGFGVVVRTRPAPQDVVAALHRLISGLPGSNPVDTIVSP